MLLSIVYDSALDLCKDLCCSIVLRWAISAKSKCSDLEELSEAFADAFAQRVFFKAVYMVFGLTKLATPEGQVQRIGELLVPNFSASPQ